MNNGSLRADKNLFVGFQDQHREAKPLSHRSRFVRFKRTRVCLVWAGVTELWPSQANSGLPPNTRLACEPWVGSLTMWLQKDYRVIQRQEVNWREEVTQCNHSSRSNSLAEEESSGGRSEEVNPGPCFKVSPDELSHLPRQTLVHLNGSKQSENTRWRQEHIKVWSEDHYLWTITQLKDIILGPGFRWAGQCRGCYLKREGRSVLDLELLFSQNAPKN